MAIVTNRNRLHWDFVYS